MTDYLVYRHGANAANQSVVQTSPLAIVTASSRDEACLKASGHHTVYANQMLSAVPRSRARQSDWNSVVDRSAYDQSAVID
jgi:hypothetical protein